MGREVRGSARLRVKSYCSWQLTLLGSPLDCLVLRHLQHVEPDSLAERPALANSDLVTDVDTESRAAVGGKVLVSLLVTVVLWHKVQVFTANDDSALHLGADHAAGQKTTTDRNQTCPRALLVCRGSMPDV